jgi:NADH dehydrogenase [ubiquinone] 1 alpha subcomplex assembly factor 5
MIFNRQRRRNLHQRMDQADASDQWLLRYMAETLIDRVSDSSVPFKNALIIGHPSPALSAQLKLPVIRSALASNGADIIADEDRLPIADESFDLVVALGTLDSVDDIPGALNLIKRVLRPGGLFLGAMMGAGALPILRRCIAHGDALVGVAAARFHPQIDVRAAGDLLTRAGFSMPVADQDRMEARYTGFEQLITDLRANGLSNVLLNSAPISKTAARVAAKHFDTLKDRQGRATEVFTPLFMTGWRPAVDEILPQGPVKQAIPIGG